MRKAAIETLSEIAEQCDSVQCDMTILMLNAIFERTWGARAGVRPADDFWKTVIAAIQSRHRGFKFIAEAYWDLEWELQQQGFDWCYDKKLYDRMEHADAESVRLHLLAERSYQDKMVRFIENHDEPRAAAAFSSGQARAAAVAILTLPGAKLLHQGQFEGVQARLPVFLARRPVEPVDPELVAFYERLLQTTRSDVFKSGSWRLCDRSGWPDNSSFRSVLAWCWAKDDERWFVVVHFGPGSAQARVQLPWDDLRGKTWHLDDPLSGDAYDRSGDEMRDAGLYVELGPWKCHLFRLSAA